MISVKDDKQYRSVSFSMTEDTLEVVEKLAKYFDMRKSNVIRFAINAIAKQYGITSN